MGNYENFFLGSSFFFLKEFTIIWIKIFKLSKNKTLKKFEKKK